MRARCVISAGAGPRKVARPLVVGRRTILPQIFVAGSIDGTILAQHARDRVNKSRRARTAGVNARKASPVHRIEDVQLSRLAYGDFRYRQVRVVAEAAARDLDLHCRPIASGSRWASAGFCGNGFIGRF